MLAAILLAPLFADHMVLQRDHLNAIWGTDTPQHVVTLTVEGDGGKAIVAGTVANGEPRLIRIDDSWLDMAPAPFMLMTRHQDKPGTMGRIGLILGEADVNISSMTLARTAPQLDALMLLAVDDEVPDSVLAEIRNSPAVLDVWSIKAATDR